IPVQLRLLFILTWIVLCCRIHPRAVGFIVPPRQAKIRRDHVRSRMHVTDYALRSRNLARELMLDWMAWLVSGNIRVGRLRLTAVASHAVRRRGSCISIVRVDDMTFGTTRRSIVAGMIIRTEKVKRWIKQARFLET